MTVQYINNDAVVIAEEQERGEESVLYTQSPLTAPTRTRPRYVRFDAIGNLTQRNRIEITPFPNPATDDVFISYIRLPERPRWSYNVVNGQALLNANGTIDFELHNSEQGELIHKILGYAGITIKNPDIINTAATLEKNKLQQEKQ